MSLQREIEQLKKEVVDLAESLRLIENPPERYGPRPGELPILDFLKLELQAQKSDQERQKLLEMSRQALSDAQTRLATKEEELRKLEADCQAIASEISAAGEAVVAAEAAYRDSLEKFKALAQKHEPQWRKLHPNEELYRQMSSVSLPTFVMFRGCGVFTSEALGRDLR